MRLDEIMPGFGLFNPIVFAGPFSQINQLAAFTAKRTKRVAGVPLMFFAAMRAGHDQRRFALHHEEMLQKVNSKGTSCSNRVDLGA